MATKTQKPENKGKKDENEECLNFLSPKFDPLKALYMRSLQPPIQNIQIFNNLAEYVRAIKGVEGKLTKAREKNKKPAYTQPASTRTRNLKPEFQPKAIEEKLRTIAENLKGSDENVSKSSTFASYKFAAEMARIQEREAAGRKKKRFVNVFDKMEACSEGPFSILYTCLKEKKLMKVWTRRYRGLRGVMCGYLIAFDKHMNLAMMDVDEVYTLEKRITRDETENLSAVKKKKKKKKNKNIISKDTLEIGNNEAIEGKEDLEKEYIQNSIIEKHSEEIRCEKSLCFEGETVESSQKETEPSDSECKSKSDYPKHTVFRSKVMDRYSELDEPKSSDEELGIDAASLNCALKGDTVSYGSTVLNGCARTRGSTVPLLSEHSRDIIDALSDGASTQEFVTASVSFEDSEAAEDESSVMEDGCARTRGSKTSVNELHFVSNVLACETDDQNSNGNWDNNEDKGTNSQGNLSLENISKDFPVEGSSARTRGSRKFSLCETNIVRNCSDVKTFQTKPSLTEVPVLKDGQKIDANFTSESSRGSAVSNSSVPTAGLADATCLAIAFSNHSNIREIQDRNSVESRRIIDSQDSNQREYSENKLGKGSIDEQNSDVYGSENVTEVKVVCKPEFMNAIHSEEHQKVSNIPLSVEDDKQSLTTNTVQCVTTRVECPTGKKSEITTDVVSTKITAIIFQQGDIALESFRSGISDPVLGEEKEVAVSSQSIGSSENDSNDNDNCFKREKYGIFIAKGNQASFATNDISKEVNETANEGGPSNTKFITDNLDEMKSVDSQCSRKCEFDMPEVETTVTTTAAASSEKECNEPQQNLHLVGYGSSESFHNQHYMCKTEQKVSPPENSKAENILSDRDFWKEKDTLKLHLTDNNTLNKQEGNIPFNKTSDRAESKGKQEAAPGEVDGSNLVHTDENSQKNVRSNCPEVHESCAERYLESIATTSETKNTEHSTESSVSEGGENSKSKNDTFSQIETKNECDAPLHNVEKNSVFGILESERKELQECDTAIATQNPETEKRNTLCKSSDIRNDSVFGSCEERTDVKTIASSCTKGTGYGSEAKSVPKFTNACVVNEINVKSSNKIDPNMKDKSLLSNRKQIDPSGEPGSEKEEGEITSSDEEATVVSKSDMVEGKSSQVMKSNISIAKVIQPKDEKEEGELSSSEEEDSPDRKREETKKRLPKDEKVAKGGSGKSSKNSSLSASSRTRRGSTGKGREVKTHIPHDKRLVKHSERKVENETKHAHSSAIAARGQEIKSKKGASGEKENDIQQKGTRLKTDKKTKIASNTPEKATTAKHTDLRDLLTIKHVKDKCKLFSGERRDAKDFFSTSSKREVGKGSNNAKHRVGKNLASDEKRRALTSNVKSDRQLSKYSVAGSHRLGNKSQQKQMSRDNDVKQPATPCERKIQKDKDTKSDCNERNLDNLETVDKRKTQNVIERRNRGDKDSKKPLHHKRQLRSPNIKSKSQERKRSISVSPERKGKKRLQSNNENDKPLKRQRVSCGNEISSKRSKNCTSAQTRKDTVLLTDKKIGSSDLRETRHELLNKSSKFESQIDSDSKKCEGQSSSKENNSPFEKDVDKIRKNESVKEVKQRKAFQVKEVLKCVKGCSQQESRLKTSNRSRRSTDQYNSKHQNLQTFDDEEKKDRNNLLRSRENSRDLDKSELNKTLIAGQHVAVRSKENVSVIPSADGHFSSMREGTTYRNRAQKTDKDLDSSGPSSKSETSSRGRKAASNTNTTIRKNRSAPESSAEKETLQSSRLSTKKERPKIIVQRMSANKAVKPSMEEQPIGCESNAETEALQGRTLMTSRNKYLVFKRRHVNQLFVRGDNVVMVGYAR